MARRTILIGLAVILFTAALASPAYCNDPGKKLGRGICNLFTFPFEFYTQFTQVNNDVGLFAAVSWGIIKGVGMSAVRLTVGAYEVATFPFPIPRDYMPILTDPEFYGEDMVR